MGFRGECKTRHLGERGDKTWGRKYGPKKKEKKNRGVGRETSRLGMSSVNAGKQVRDAKVK